jgi:hypothetical protein
MTDLEYISTYGFRNWLYERRSRRHRDYWAALIVAFALGVVARHVCG